MRHRTNMVTQIMNEVTLYGGLPMRRCDILILAWEHMGEGAREPFGAQYFALHGPAVAMEPWPLAEARKVME